MVKRLFVPMLFIIAITSPAMAQEDEFARVEMGFGYANYGLPSSAGTDRINGFSMHSGLNLSSWFGIENFTGAYSAGNDTTLIANIVGAKLVARDLVSGRISPYLVGGIGAAYFTNSNSNSGFSAAATRFGGGIDFNLTGGMALKVDVSRLAINNIDVGGGWASNMSISTGIVFNIGF